MPWPAWLSWLGMSCKAKGCQFDSWSGHVPELQAWFLVGACATGNRSMFVSYIIVFLPALPNK